MSIKQTKYALLFQHSYVIYTPTDFTYTKLSPRYKEEFD